MKIKSSSVSAFESSPDFEVKQILDCKKIQGKLLSNCLERILPRGENLDS